MQCICRSAMYLFASVGCCCGRLSATWKETQSTGTRENSNFEFEACLTNIALHSPLCQNKKEWKEALSIDNCNVHIGKRSANWLPAWWRSASWHWNPLTLNPLPPVAATRHLLLSHRLEHVRLTCSFKRIYIFSEFVPAGIVNRNVSCISKPYGRLAVSRCGFCWRQGVVGDGVHGGRCGALNSTNKFACMVLVLWRSTNV